ncbi:band 7 protein [Solea senegalensis]|uniref:Podocin n=1 Tax=Solea senegalensis TaxID=28829 RepID=A0AAV6T2E3_SOLSE|nr:band 7 protein [Solea senegalensis]
MNRVGVVCEDAAEAAEQNKDGRRSDGVMDLLRGALTLLSAALIILTFPFTAWMCAKVVLEYERAVIFRLGRIVKGRPKGPGLFWFIPWLDNIQIVDLRTVSFNVQQQEVLTADGVSLQVDAVMFYRVVDPSLWVTRVQDGDEAMHTLAQTTLRAALGAHTLTEVLAQRRYILQRMRVALYTTTRVWGVQVQRVELKDMRLPLIAAEGEVKASHALSDAASGLSPVAFHLRYLQSLSSVSSSSSIVVFTLPTELLQAFSHQS